MTPLHFIILCFSLIFTACATQTTFYVDGKPNYRTWSVEKDGDFKVAIFDGNQYTPKSRSYAFSRLGAIIDCANTKKMALIVATLDESSSFTQLQTTTSTTPINTRRGTQYLTQSSTIPVTNTFPHHYSYYKCVDKFMTLVGAPTLETISKELVSPFTGDFKGGVLIKNPNLNKTLQANDLIVKANNVRVQSLLELTTTLAEASMKSTLSIYRNKKELSVSVNLEDKTDGLVADLAKDTQIGCEEVKKDAGELPEICGGQNKTAQKPVQKAAPIDESKLSNKEIKRLRNQQQDQN